MNRDSGDIIGIRGEIGIIGDTTFWTLVQGQAFIRGKTVPFHTIMVMVIMRVMVDGL